MSRHVLVLSYHFPPIGGAGAQRPARLARRLAERGIRSTVLTGPGHTAGRWTPMDSSLADDVAPGVAVHRLAAPEPASTPTEQRASRWLMRSSAWARWWVSGVQEAGRAVGEVDLVYAYMSPYESAEAGARLAAALGCAWIADLGDPWALDEMMVFPSRWHREAELRRMRYWLGRADGVVMSTREAVRRVQETFPEFRAKPMEVVPNGFEPDDFREPVPARSEDTFRIVHTGYLHTDLGRRQRRAAVARRLLGGQTPGVDILTRSHVYLLEALEQLQASAPDRKIEALFAGVLSDADREAAACSRASRLLGYLPHDESTELIRTADLLFLPMQNLPPSARATIVPGKTYEYLAAGRPILAAVPHGDIREILSRAGTAFICDPDDVAGMVRAIEAAIEMRAGGAALSLDSAYVAQFGYDALAERVLAFVEEVLERRRQLNDVPEPAPTGGARVAYLAYYFPPIGGAGAQRSLKAVRYLPESGVTPVVVTGRGRAAGRWSPLDESLGQEVPADVEVRRVTSAEPRPTDGWRRRAESWLLYPSEWRRWWVEGAAAIGTELEVDAVYASMSPYASAEAAARIAAATGRPWIAELRDPWALDEMIVFPTRFHRRAELRRMEEALSTAAAIVMNTPDSAARLRAALPRLAHIPVAAIANGYDAEDFAGAVSPRSDPAFRIVHSGYFHTQLGRHQRRIALRSRLLGGAVRGVDILTRSHVFLLEAVERVLRDDPDAPIEVHLVGRLSSADVEIALRYPFVSLGGYVPHRACVHLLRTADLLFLPMQNLPRGTRATIVPGKTYEYLAARRPILAAVPEGDARDLLAQSGVAEITDPGDVAGMADAIRRQMHRWRAGEPIAPNEELLRRFERRRLAGEVAAVIESVVAAAGERPPRPRGEGAGGRGEGARRGNPGPIAHEI